MIINKKFILLIAFISLFFSITTLQDTYAKYTSQINGITEMSIARWRVLVNNHDIRNGNNLSSVIQPVFSGNNNIASNIIAPTATGYFDLLLDATDADVSFRYTVTVTDNIESCVSDLTTIGYSFDNGEIYPVALDEDITGTIMYDDPHHSTVMRVYIIWDDSINANMNNAEDTATTYTASCTAKLNVNINLTQIPMYNS